MRKETTSSASPQRPMELNSTNRHIQSPISFHVSFECIWVAEGKIRSSTLAAATSALLCHDKSICRRLLTFEGNGVRPAAGGSASLKPSAQVLTPACYDPVPRGLSGTSTPPHTEISVTSGTYFACTRWSANLSSRGQQK